MIPRAPRAGKPERYRDFNALRGISFRVPQGESFGIIGRNGSGKSTLLQIIAGTLQPTTGSVQVNGRVAALLELGSGFNPDFTGRENIFLNAAVHGLARSEVEERFDSIAAFADIGDFLDQPVKTYSSGMALRLAFSVIAHIDASVLIIDEALAVGDIYFMQKCMRFLREFRERGVLLFVSHDISAVKSLCDKALWLDSGNARLIGSAQDVANEYLAEFNLSQNNREVSQPGPTSHQTREESTSDNSPTLEQQWNLPTPPVVCELSVSTFNTDSASFGDGNVKIKNVSIQDTNGNITAKVLAGTIVRLVITAEAHETVGNVILGFNMKDRLGQHLFGENTFAALQGKTQSLLSGESITAEFSFQMPILHRGTYTVAAAVATGDQDNHRQQHWVHDALAITSATDWPHPGLIGLPMLKVQLNSPMTSAVN